MLDLNKKKTGNIRVCTDKECFWRNFTGPCNVSLSYVTAKCQTVPDTRGAFSHNKSGTVPDDSLFPALIVLLRVEPRPIKAVEELTWVEKGDCRKTMPFLGISIRYPGGRKALKPKTRSGCPWKSCDTRFITPGVSMLLENGQSFQFILSGAMFWRGSHLIKLATM